jgi:hypothetical protein
VDCGTLNIKNVMFVHLSMTNTLITSSILYSLFLALYVPILQILLTIHNTIPRSPHLAANVGMSPVDP